MKTTLTNFRILAPVLFSACLASSAVLAGGTNAPSGGPGMEEHHMGHGFKGEGHWDPTAHIEGRIAFLKTELKITDAQDANWSKVADAIRKQASDEKAMHPSSDSEPKGDTIQSLEETIKVTSSRLADEQAFLAVFKPLYASFSDEQKKSAAELIAHQSR